MVMMAVLKNSPREYLINWVAHSSFFHLKFNQSMYNLRHHKFIEDNNEEDWSKDNDLGMSFFWMVNKIGFVVE